MELEINRNKKVPLYLQIKEQLKEYILVNQLQKGSQLPTERELSIKLRVSRNTVSMAYKDLVQEKIISSIPGKGTFIVTEVEQNSKAFDNIKKTPFARNIDIAIEKAIESNIPLDDFIRLVNYRFKEKRTQLNNIHIAFIECNQEQLIYFSQRIELGTGVHIIPILIDEMYKQRDIFLRKMRSVDLVVTTFFHFQEMQDFLKKENKKIVAIALEPQIETMVQIAHNTSSETDIGLVCLTSKFAERVIKSINNVGIKYRKITFTSSRKKEELKELIDNSDIIIVSPGRKKEIKSLISRKTSLIEFIYVPDKGSIETLKKNIFDIKRKE